MFEMFKGGKPDALTLMAVTEEERKQKIKEMIKAIKKDLENREDPEPLNIAPYVKKFDLDTLTRKEFQMIQSEIED